MAERSNWHSHRQPENIDSSKSFRNRLDSSFPNRFKLQTANINNRKTLRLELLVHFSNRPIWSFLGNFPTNHSLNHNKLIELGVPIRVAPLDGRNSSEKSITNVDHAKGSKQQSLLRMLTANPTTFEFFDWNRIYWKFMLVNFSSYKLINFPPD